jgi:hypothetical protein
MKEIKYDDDRFDRIAEGEKAIIKLREIKNHIGVFHFVNIDSNKDLLIENIEKIIDHE